MTDTTFHVSMTEMTVHISLAGPPGPAGQDGQDGTPGTPGMANAVVGCNFQYNHASPVRYPLTIPAGQVLLECRLIVNTPFDGAGASVVVGTAADPDQFFSEWHSDLTQAGCYSTSPFVRVSEETEVLITINPGQDPTQGSGTVVIYFEVVPN